MIQTAFYAAPYGRYVMAAEDGALTGYYEVNEEAKTVKLMYGEALEDAVFYYQIMEEGLFIEYPWLMEKIGSR